jgi:hypothetical protein
MGADIEHEAATIRFANGAIERAQLIDALAFVEVGHEVLFAVGQPHALDLFHGNRL